MQFYPDLLWRKKHEVAYNLSIFILNLFPKVSTLSSLAAIILVKIVIYLFQIVTWPQKGHVIKVPVDFNNGNLSR